MSGFDPRYDAASGLIIEATDQAATGTTFVYDADADLWRSSVVAGVVCVANGVTELHTEARAAGEGWSSPVTARTVLIFHSDGHHEREPYQPVDGDTIVHTREPGHVRWALNP